MRASATNGIPRTIPKDAKEVLAAAEVAAQRAPNEPTAWIALSKARHTLLDHAGMLAAARRAYELQPDNIDAIRQLAYCGTQAGALSLETLALFERVLALAPSDPTALHYLHFQSMFVRDYDRAIELLRTFDRAYPGSPNVLGRIARAQRFKGDAIAATDTFAQAAQRCDSPAEPFPHGPLAPLKPAYTALAGEHDLAYRLSLQLCQNEGVGLADLGNPGYPDNAKEAVARLRAQVKGRDLFVFGHGPSLQQVVLRRAELAPFEFSSMTMSSFQIIDQDLLMPIGRRIEISCMTHPFTVTRQIAAIRDWFTAVPDALLALPLWVGEFAEMTDELRVLRECSRNIFWYDCQNELPPTPARPLHIPPINTLLCALGVAVLACPRRIFLFGFDGQVPEDTVEQPGGMYYREDHEGYHVSNREDLDARHTTRATIWWETVQFNEVAATVLRHLALLHDLPQPPIYNVCEDSALEPFPRISFEQFMKLAGR